MEASMIMPPMGSKLKVMGIKIAVPAAGPNPGRTPMRVPRTQPIKANMRFMGIVATEKPCIQY
jgi:hypothetical protein